MAPEVKPVRDTASNLRDWLCGCVAIYAALFVKGRPACQCGCGKPTDKDRSGWRSYKNGHGPHVRLQGNNARKDK